MGRRQNDSKEETWRTEHWDIQELHKPGTIQELHKPGTKDTKCYTSVNNMYKKRHGQGKEQWSQLR